MVRVISAPGGGSAGDPKIGVKKMFARKKRLNFSGRRADSTTPLPGSPGVTDLNKKPALPPAEGVGV